MPIKGAGERARGESFDSGGARAAATALARSLLWAEGREGKAVTHPCTFEKAGGAALLRESDSAEQLFEAFLESVALQQGKKPPTLREFVELAEAWRIMHALQRCRGNRSAAARQLGIGRRTLYTKMEKLGIEQIFRVRSHEAPATAHAEGARSEIAAAGAGAGLPARATLG